MGAKSLGSSLLNTRLGEWKLERVLGEGGMGVVFDARGPGGERAALKVVRPELVERGEPLARFRREAKTLQSVDHPNVVRLLDVGEHDGHAYIALEFIDGPSLADVIVKRKSLQPGDVRKLATDVLRGLCAVHDEGIAHRDVKPPNIMRGADGLWKLTDFGLARRDEKAESIAVTQPGMSIGTPLYMSPEQCLGEPTDARSDLYSLGVTLFHALTGAPPFRAAAMVEIVKGHLHGEVPDVAKIVKGTPRDLANLIAKCLAKLPGDRPQSARAALKAIGADAEARAGGTDPSAPTVVDSNGRPSAGPRAPASAGAAARRASERVAAPGARTPSGRAPVFPNSAPIPRPASGVPLPGSGLRPARGGPPWGRFVAPALLAGVVYGFMFACRERHEIVDAILSVKRFFPDEVQLKITTELVDGALETWAPRVAIGLLAFGVLRVAFGPRRPRGTMPVAVPVPVPGGAPVPPPSHAATPPMPSVERTGKASPDDTSDDLRPADETDAAYERTRAQLSESKREKRPEKKPEPARAASGRSKLSPGEEIERYKVINFVGEGATAWVYKAEHTFLKRVVALKILKPPPDEEDALADRFLAEGRAVAAIRHPCLIEVYDCGRTEQGALYMALEFIEGPSLRGYLNKKKGLPVAEAAWIGAGVLAGLGAAHRCGIVHRDLKPENILLAQGNRPKVVDFGIAKILATGGGTMTGAYLGTPKYTSPEQASGGEVGPAADQYALGIILYEMLAGRPPFEATTVLGYLTKHAQTTPPPLGEQVKDVPPDLETAIMRALEKDPAKRFPGVEAMREVVQRFAQTEKR